MILLENIVPQTGLYFNSGMPFSFTIITTPSVKVIPVEDTPQKFNYRLNAGSQETAYNKSVRLKRNHEGRAIIMRINALYSKTTGNSRDWIARSILWTRSA